MVTEILFTLGLVMALVIGLVLGLLGGGGAVLAVPVLVYLMGVHTDLATAYSLFVVGITAAAGSVHYVRQAQVNWQVVLLFVLPSMAAVLLTRHFVLPALPEVVFYFHDHPISRKPVVMILFAILMAVAGISMKRKTTASGIAALEGVRAMLIIVLWGAVVGFLSGLLGAGGGFMIVPVLVLFLGLPIKQAVGTSITIIALQSLVGFAGDMGVRDINWSFLLLFTALSLAGMAIGAHMGRTIAPERVRNLFGTFILVLGGIIVLLELWALNI